MFPHYNYFGCLKVNRYENRFCLLSYQYQTIDVILKFEKQQKISQQNTHTGDRRNMKLLIFCELSLIFTTQL